MPGTRAGRCPAVHALSVPLRNASASSPRCAAVRSTDDSTDCAAAPALYYANRLVPFAEHGHVVDYFARLVARPSYARVLEEAKPYLHMFPA